MTAFAIAASGPALWLMSGAALGIGATALLHRLRAWRAARFAAEWDPY